MKNKKIIFISISCVLILGIFAFMFVLLDHFNTENKYEGFEHYDLKDKDITTYTFHYNQEKLTYAVADISNENALGATIGLFYQIGDDDYILLDKIDSCYFHNGGDLKHTYFYEDEENDEYKLFICRCMSTESLEYTLNREKFEKKELQLNTSKVFSEISDDMHIEYINYIERVEQGNIYYTATIKEGNRDKVSIKCSLENYMCELAE